MPYCTAVDVKAILDNTLLAQLTTPNGNIPDDTAITNAATSASTWIDSYLIGRYVVPITTPQIILDILKPHACWLTVANLFQDRLMLEEYKSFDDNSKDTQRWLEAIQLGKTILPGAQTQTLSVGQSGALVASPWVNSDGSVTLP